MSVDLKQTEQPRQQRGQALMRGMVWGLIGGFIATIVLDLTSVGTLAALGYPGGLELYFNVVGETSAIFFSKIGLPVAGSLLLGGIMSYTIGMGLGVIYGVIVSQVNSLQVDRTKRLLFCILFIEVITQPLVATAPGSQESNWAVAETWQWFLTSFYIHMVYAIVLGVFVDFGLRFAAGKRSRRLSRKPELPTTESPVHSS